MDRLTKVDIEKALRDLLPGCTIKCTTSADGTASLLVGGADGESFAVVGLIRSDFRGEAGLNKLARFIVEDINMARRGLKTHRVRRLSPVPSLGSAPPTLNKVNR